MGKIIKTVTADAESYRADWAYRSINSTHADVVVTDNYGRRSRLLNTTTAPTGREPVSAIR
jgi:hypothetical protein